MIDPGYLNEILQEINNLPDDADKDAIAQTERELNGYNYSPVMTLEVPGFFTATKKDIVQFLGDIPDTRLKELNKADISLVIYHFRLLQKLRRNDPESWDIITELMDED